MYNPMVNVLQIVDSQLLGPLATLYYYVYKDRKGFCRTDNKEELQATAREVYRENHDVRRLYPKERLFDFQ